MRLLPDLCLPSSKSDSGVISVIPIGGIYIKEIVERDIFNAIVIRCDGPSVNKCAYRMLTRELQKFGKLIVFSNICSSRGINNSIRWGLGVFPYGGLLRSAHVFGAVKDRATKQLLPKYLMGDIKPDHPFGEDGAARAYLEKVEGGVCTL